MLNGKKRKEKGPGRKKERGCPSGRNKALYLACKQMSHLLEIAHWRSLSEEKKKVGK